MKRLTAMEKRKRQSQKDWNRTKAIWNSLQYLIDSSTADCINHLIENNHFKNSWELRRAICSAWDRALDRSKG